MIVIVSGTLLTYHHSISTNYEQSKLAIRIPSSLYTNSIETIEILAITPDRQINERCKCKIKVNINPESQANFTDHTKIKYVDLKNGRAKLDIETGMMEVIIIQASSPRHENFTTTALVGSIHAR